MKAHSYLLAIAFLLTLVHVRAQSTGLTSKFDFYITTGMRYSPGIGGPVLGLSLYSPDKKFAFNFRHDILLTIGRSIIPYYHDTSSMLRLEQHKYDITSFETTLFTDIDYKIRQFKNASISASLGIGWTNFDENYTAYFDRLSGYYIMTMAVKCKINWLIIEPRCDIPLLRPNTVQTKFPLYISLLYRFKPKLRD